MYPDRIVSGMRPTGAMHLGHYHGLLNHWIRLQTEMPCLFFVADWLALATRHDDPSTIENRTWEVLVDWLAMGVVLSMVRAIVADGCDHARKLAQETVREVREVRGLSYS